MAVRRPTHIGFFIGLFVAVGAGWAGYDLCAVLLGGAPYLVPKLLPSYAATLLVLALVGGLCAIDRRILGSLLLFATIAAVVPAVSRLDISWTLSCFFRGAFLILAAAAAADALGWRGTTTLWSAAGLGIVGAAVFGSYSEGLTSFRVSALMVGIVLTASSASQSTRWRRTIVVAALIVPAAFIAWWSQGSSMATGAVQRPGAVGAGAPPNLVLIVLDTVSAHHLNLYGYSEVTTPGLDEFVRNKAVRYTQARSVSSWTLPAHASILTGLYPSEHGADHPRPPNRGVEEADLGPARRLALEPAVPLRSDVGTLAERLANAGFQTGAVVANSGYLSRQFGIARGFQDYDDNPAISSMLLPQFFGLAPEFRKGSSRRGESITYLALRWLDAAERRRPFFLFLNYMDAHAPYEPASPYDRDPNPYDGELRYLDVHLTHLLQGLETRGLLDDTVVIVTADHGEAFGEHGLWKHDKGLYEELIRVPLYVKRAGPGSPGTSDRPVTSTDVYQIALDALGLPLERPLRESPITAEWYQTDAMTAAAQAKRGESIVPLDRDLLVWFQGNQKWVVSSRGTVEVYDLDADPMERNPLPVEPDQAEGARARAHAWWDAHPPATRADHSSGNLDPAIIERLRNLGYGH